MAEARLYSRCVLFALALIAGTASFAQAQVQGETIRVRPLVRDGKLYVGGTKGVAALDEKGAVIWSQELPEADGRAVDVEGDHPCPFAHIGPNRGRADAAGATGDDRSLPLQQHREVPKADCSPTVKRASSGNSH